jgi:glycosyltransferase involved in cell wall biosynthesis
MISIVLPVHNKDDLIGRVLDGIWANSSALVKEVLIIIDGCTDRSEAIIMDFVHNQGYRGDIEVKVTYAPNVFEVKACNIGLKWATQPFVVSVQDDMVITEKGWDIRLIKPALVWNDVFAVTALAATDITLDDTGHISWPNITNLHNSPRNMFAVRDTVNRGPLLFRHSMLETLGYLDEAFAPLGMDDQDICFRAWRLGWVSGVYPMPHFADPSWGTTRRTSQHILAASESKNANLLMARHRDAMIGPKHTENRLLEA